MSSDDDTSSINSSATSSIAGSGADSASSGWESGEIRVDRNRFPRQGDFDGDPFPLETLPVDLCDSIFFKMDLTSRILMKATSAGMDEVMDKYIRQEELQAFYAKLVENYDELTESAMQMRGQQHGAFQDNDHMWQWAAEEAAGDMSEQHEIAEKLRSMRSYLQEKYPNVELEDWDSGDDFGSGPYNEWDDFEVDLADIDEYESDEDFGEIGDEDYDDDDY